MKPETIPPEIEDEILEAFTTYSMEDDMKVEHLESFYKDLSIPKYFTERNKRIDPNELTIEGTDIIDFDKLLIKSYQLIILRNNRHLIQQTWDLLQSAFPESNGSSRNINVKNLKNVSDDVKSGISDPLLLDMVAVATDGEGVEVKLVDFAYVLGKLGELSNE